MRWTGSDATDAFTDACHSISAQNLLQTFCVGKLEPDEQEEHKETDNCGTFSVSSAAAIERYLMIRLICIR